MSPHVEYRPCPRLPDGPVMSYRFGRDGSVWLRKWNGPWRRKKVHHEINRRTKKAYASIRVVLGGGTHQRLQVGPLVLSAFGQPRPLGFECSYRNGNGTDVRLDNLEWRRAGHKLRGRSPVLKGSESPQAVLTEAKVVEMRQKYAYGATAAELAQEYGLSERNAIKAITGANWAHVPGAVRMRRGVVWGSSQGTAKLDEIDVIEIRSLLKQGLGQRQVASQFGVSRSLVSKIALGQIWIHVPEDAELVGADA